jgi:hypothetical protein
MFSHVAGELGHLNFLTEKSLEAGKEDLPLTRLEAIDNRGD